MDGRSISTISNGWQSTRVPNDAAIMDDRTSRSAARRECRPPRELQVVPSALRKLIRLKQATVPGDGATGAASVPRLQSR